jgi:hypothetical protein
MAASGFEDANMGDLNSGNDLIRARRAGRISRRRLIARAGELGLALPVVGALLHATADFAFGQENPQPTPAAGETYPGGAPLAGASISAGVIGEFDTANP